VFAGTADLYVYFVERAFQLLKPNGQFAYIIPNKWMKAAYGQNLRHWIKQYQLHSIADFGELRVFAEAATFPAIFLASKKPARQSLLYAPIRTLAYNGTLQAEIERVAYPIPLSSLADQGWSMVEPASTAILEQMNTLGIPLKSYLGDKSILYGIKTGFNKAFILETEAERQALIDADPRSAELIKPFAVGNDIRKNIVRRGKYVILTKIGVPIQQYPAVFEHLKKYQTELETRQDKGNHWWELRACAYYDKFERSKIMYPVIAKEPRFVLVDEELYSNDKTFFIPARDLFLLGLLNSMAIWFYLKSICSVLGDADKGGRLELRAIYVNQIPIAQATLEQKEDIETLVAEIVTRKKIGKETQPLENQLEALIFALYSLSESQMLQILDGFRDLSIKDRTQIHNEFRNIRNRHFHVQL
jgi:hypothetical protein